MRIGIHSPYLDTLGGGERYMLTLASHWSREHDVTVFWDFPILADAGERFGLPLSRVRQDKNIFGSAPLATRLAITAKYDVMVFLTDGSVPMSLARTNILHVQVPFAIDMSPLKRLMYRAVVCNSRFTAGNMGLRFKPVSVIYPPVDTAAFSPGNKTRTILAVGRFTSDHTAKRQDVLIRAFRGAITSGKLKDVRLVMAGGLLAEDKGYLEALKREAHGLPVEFKPNIRLDGLKALYAEASVYWHAAGFGQTEPRWMEHFGITTVEAMAAGCVPVVFEGGGQPEIVRNGENGYLWKTTEELVERTAMLFRDTKVRKRMSDEAKGGARRFDAQKFGESFDALLAKLTHAK